MSDNNNNKGNDFYIREKKAIKRGFWTVDLDGSLTYDDYYHIDVSQLKDEDWILHLASKGWIDWNEFIPAYFQALYNADIDTIKLRVFR